MLLREALYFGQPPQLTLDFLRQYLGANPQTRQKGRHHSISLPHQRLEEMEWHDLLVLVTRRDFLSSLHRFLGFHRHFFESQHVCLTAEGKGAGPLPSPYS